MAYSKARRLAEIISDANGNLSVEGIIVPTQSSSDNDTSAASTAFVHAHIDAVLDSAPGTLNTLNEIAAALNDDANFNTTVTNAIAAKLPLAGGTMTGNIQITKVSPKISMTSTGSGDSELYFQTASNGRGIYLDESDSNKLKIYDGSGKGTAGEVVIDNTGNVGIGTASPAAPLHVGGEAYFDAGTRHYTYDDQANFWSLYTNTDDTFRVNYNGSGDDEVVINTSGNVGIGTTSPSQKLDVAGNLKLSDGYLEFDKPNVKGFRFLQNDIGNDLSIQQGDTNNANYVTKLNISSAGNVGIGTTPSSKLQIMGGTSGVDQIHISSNLTDNTIKYAGIITTMFTNNTAALLGAKAENGNTSLLYGSSGTDHRGVTKHLWYTNSNYNSTSGNTERMRIDSAGTTIVTGNMAIGAVPNTARLRVEQSVSGEWAMNIKHASTGVNYGLSIETSAGATNDVGALQVYPPSGGGLIFTNRSKLGIGTNAPENELHVKGSNNSAGDLFTQVGPGNCPSITIQNAGTTDNNNAALYFRDDQDMRGSIGMRFTGHGTHSSELRFATTTANNTREKFVMTAAGQLGINKMSGFDSGGFGTPMLVIKQSVNNAWGGINVEAAGNDSIFSVSCLESGASLNTSYRTSAGHKPLNIMCAGQSGIEIGTGGYVKIGSGNVASNAQSHHLHVDSGNTGYGIKIQSTHGYGTEGSNNGSYYHHTSDRAMYYWDKACYANGGFHTYSDSRLKENVTAVTGALDKVALMNGVTFTWDNSEKVRGPEGKQFGVLAQNMLEVDSDLPTLNVDPLEEQDNIDDSGQDTDYYSMDYSRLTPFFIEAIKELKTKLEAAEARIATLEG